MTRGKRLLNHDNFFYYFFGSSPFIATFALRNKRIMIMEGTGTLHPQPTVFNAAQLYLLDVFAGIRSEEELNDIRQLVADYYARKLDEMTEAMWQSGELDQKRLDEISQMDLHQWLREQKEKEKIAV